jgi:hypothetical protein
MALAVAAGCGGSPELTIVEPADGATITTTDPIAIKFSVSDWEATSAEVVIDNTLLYPNNQAQYGTYSGGSCPADGTGFITWAPPATFANTPHTINIRCMYDLAGPDDQITLVFQRPAP